MEKDKGIRFTKPLTGENDSMRYIAVIALVLFALYFISSIPVVIAVQMRTTVADLKESDSTLISDFFTHNEYFVLLMVPFAIGVLSIFYGAKRVLRRPLLSLITLRSKIDWNRFGLSFLIWSILVLGIGYLFSFGSESEIKWNYHPKEFWTLVVLAVLLTPLQTLFEELFFRGLILQFAGTFVKKGFVIILINGLAFAAMHLLNSEVSELGYFALVYYSISGMYASILTVLDDGVELAWGFHTANNLIGIVIITSTWQSFQTDALFLDQSAPTIGAEMLVTLFVLYPLLVFILAKRYRWKDWKNRLF